MGPGKPRPLQAPKSRVHGRWTDVAVAGPSVGGAEDWATGADVVCGPGVVREIGQ